MATITTRAGKGSPLTNTEVDNNFTNINTELGQKLTGNQSITLSGDASGTGTTTIAVTLANSGVVAGTHTKVTVDAKGRVTTGSSLASGDLPTYTGTITSSQVTTALGFTPYNSTNPSGYITSSGSITGNAATATTLQTARTINGTSFNGSANIDTTEWVHSDRDFPSGTIITTSINYAVTNGDPFVLEIRGNSYGNIVPLDLLYQGYIYGDTIINHGGISNGYNISGLVALNVGGSLCFWFPSQGYWQGYNVKVYRANSTRAVNCVTSITGGAKPSGTKEVALSSEIRQSLHSGNYSSYALPLSGGTLTGTTYFSGANGGLQANYSGGVSFYGNEINAGALGVAGSLYIGIRNTNEVYIKGSNVAIHAGNYSSYALPLSGGTLSGPLQSGTAFTYDNAGGWGANIVAAGTHHGRFRIRATSYNGSGDRETYLWLDNTVSPATGMYSTASTFNFNGSIGTVQVAGNTVLHAGNYSSYALPLSGGTISGALTVNGTIAGGGRVLAYSTTIDMSGLNTSTYYPVTIPLPASRTTRLRIQNALNSNVPSWSTHSSGFSCYIEWITNGSGWGTIAVHRRINDWRESFSNVTIVGGITQLGNSSQEVIWLRGGGNYFFSADCDVVPTIRTSYYEIYGQSVNTSASVINDPYDQAGGRMSYGTFHATSSMLVGSNTVLHAGNYNSYSPTLTGGGASGTWGINITGNAATATSATDSTKLPLAGGTLTGRVTASVNSRTTSYTGSNFELYTSDNTPPGISFHRAGYSATLLYENDGRLFLNAWTTRAQSGELITTGNYNSYAPSLTGSGASGTWGINITGNSATAAEAQNNYFYVRGTSPSVLLVDTDQGETRYVHHNGGSIGFLNSGGSWVLRCDNSTTYGTFSGSLSGNASTASNVAASGITGQTGMWTSAGRPGPYRLYRNESDDPYNIQTTWSADRSGYWSLRGYYNDSYHAPCYVAYAGTADNAGTVASLSVHGGRNNEANKVVRTDGNGYLQTGYINSSNGDENNASSPARVWGTNGSDSYLRTYQTGSLSVGYAARSARANGDFFIDDNYGNGIVGVYSSTRYQGVYAMGNAYKLAADGTSAGNLYGMAWSYPSAGGVAGNLDSHGLLVLINGGLGSAISYSIVAAGNVTAYSDERLKTNWRPMPTGFVDRLAAVKVGIYDRTDGEKITQVGVSAQSLREVLPEAVVEAKDDAKTLSVTYGNAALAAAVELAKEVVNLRREIEELKSKLH